jgi:hypothetical protein
MIVARARLTFIVHRKLRAVTWLIAFNTSAIAIAMTDAARRARRRSGQLARDADVANADVFRARTDRWKAIGIGDAFEISSSSARQAFARPTHAGTSRLAGPIFLIQFQKLRASANSANNSKPKCFLGFH